MQYVYAVYREKSFSAAAEKLYISQPSLSANVRRVEETVGQPLFDRSTKPVSLTPCGRRYIDAAEQIMAAESAFREYLGNAEHLRTGALTIGGSNLFSSFILPPMIASFTARYPGVRVSLTEANTADLTAMMRRGDADLVIDNAQLDTAVFDRRLYREEQLLLAVPRRMAEEADPAVKEKGGPDTGTVAGPADLRRFAQLPFLLLKASNSTRTMAEAMFAAYGIRPHILLELDQQMTSYNVCCSGMGCAFISDTLIGLVPRDPGIALYRLAPELSRREVYFYWRSGRPLSRAAQVFLDENAAGGRADRQQGSAAAGGVRA